MHAFPVQRTLLSLAALLVGSLVSLAAHTTENPRERAAMLAAQAEKILNTWSGRREVIAQARQFIDEALALDPNSGHAMVEKGRAILMSDAFNNGYSPATAQAAVTLFLKATSLNPPYGRGYVLLGHLYTETGLLDEAAKSLTQAEALVPNDPWLKLNWGRLYALQGQADKEAYYAEQAIATGTTNPKAILAASEILMKSEVKKGNREKADAYFARAAETQKGNAWLRGNYAQSVVLSFGDFEAGERLAREALDIMDYGHARGILSLALYGRWARAQRDGKPPAEVEALFEAANQNDPGGRHLPSCAMNNKQVAFVYDAVFKKGVERESLRRC